MKNETSARWNGEHTLIHKGVAQWGEQPITWGNQHNWLSLDVIGNHQMYWSGLRDRHQILFLMLSKLQFTNFYFPWNHNKLIGFLMISGGIEVN